VGCLRWTYYPDGKLHTRSDHGLPVGKQVMVVDNTDIQDPVEGGVT
jgi:hypothetical protein